MNATTIAGPFPLENQCAPTHPVSVASAPGNRLGGNTTEYLYVGTSEGLIYQFNSALKRVASGSIGDSTGTPYPPIVVHPEQISLKFHGHHLYVVQPAENQITAYEQIRPLLQQDYLETTYAQTTPTGKAPMALAFLDMSATVGSIQTGVK